MSKGLIQKRIEMIKNGTNPFFVGELHTGYIVVGDHQKFRGYTLFLSKSNKTELHQLDRETKIDFLEEMSLVAECVFNAFKPDKINYELLGNGDPHMHWHIFPRYKDDGVKGPVWWLPFEEMKVELPEEQMSTLIEMLKKSILNHKEMQKHLIKI